MLLGENVKQGIPVSSRFQIEFCQEPSDQTSSAEIKSKFLLVDYREFRVLYEKGNLKQWNLALS